MRKMKKVLSVLATVVMVAAALTACGGNGKSGSATDKKDTNGDGKVKVGIVSMIENGAFMDMKEGIVAELKAQGYDAVILAVGANKYTCFLLCSISANSSRYTYRYG